MGLLGEQAAWRKLGYFAVHGGSCGQALQGIFGEEVVVLRDAYFLLPEFPIW